MQFQEWAQFPLPQRFNDQEPHDSLVLTEKMGLFWGVLAEKWGSERKYLML